MINKKDLVNKLSNAVAKKAVDTIGDFEDQCTFLFLDEVKIPKDLLKEDVSKSE